MRRAPSRREVNEGSSQVDGHFRRPDLAEVGRVHPDLFAAHVGGAEALEGGGRADPDAAVGFGTVVGVAYFYDGRVGGVFADFGGGCGVCEQGEEESEEEEDGGEEGGFGGLEGHGCGGGGVSVEMTTANNQISMKGRERRWLRGQQGGLIYEIGDP